MKKSQLVFNILTIILTCLALFSYFPYKNNKREESQLEYSTPFKKHSLPKEYISRKYHRITRNLHTKYPVTEDKSFVVVIASYNNELYCEKNLLSVFDQTYKNYRVIFIDDCSTDKTFEKVEKFAKAHGFEDKVTLIRNSERRLKLANLYKAYISCQNDEIIVCLDGDDWLAHENVLKELNGFYQNPDVWLSYSLAINHPKYEKRDGSCISDKDLKNNKIRDIPFCVSMLRTFYAGLFKMIKLKDLLYQGKFLPSADDFAFMVPMIEMAPTHSLFIPEIQYVINNRNPLREQTVINSLQNKLMKHLKKQEKYTKLHDSFHPTEKNLPENNPLLDLIILSNDSPQFLAESLENYKTNFSPLRTIYVLFKASSVNMENEYNKLIANFPTVTFIKESELSFEHLIEKSSYYVAIATDNFKLNEPIATQDCLKNLELTHSVNFMIAHPDFSSPILDLTDSLKAISIGSAIKEPELYSQSFFGIFAQKFVLDNLPDKNQSNNLLTTIFLKEKNSLETSLFFENSLATPIESDF